MKTNLIRGVLILTVAGQYLAPARADESPSLPPAITISNEQISKGHCREAWASFWNAQTNEDDLALFWIALAAFSAHVFDFSNLSVSERRDVLVPLLFYGSVYRDDGSHNLTTEIDFRPALIEVLKGPSYPEEKVSSLKKCLDENKAVSKCLPEAVSMGLIPSYSTYISSKVALGHHLPVNCQRAY